MPTLTAPPTLDEVLDALDVVRHPLRARILLELIYGGEASPNDLAGKRVTDEEAARRTGELPAGEAFRGKRVKSNPRGLGATLGSTAYHFRSLLDDELIRLVRETRIRGAVEHHYVITDAGADKVDALTRLETAEERADGA